MATKYEHLIEESQTIEDEEGQHRDQQDSGALNSKAGTCILIINNDPELFSNRKKDAEWQQLLFLTLGFDVRVYHNQTAEDINELVNLRVNSEGVFILSIISPGDQTSIQCSDGKAIQLSDMLSRVSKANEDRELPKLAIIDLYQTNGAASAVTAQNYRRIANTKNTLTIVSVTSPKNESNLTKVLYEEIVLSNKDHSLSQIAANVAQKFQDQYRQHVEINDLLEHPYYIKRGTSCMDLQEKAHKFREAASKWIPMRDGTLEKLQNTIDKLIEHRKNVNIARITGSAVSIGGAVIAVVGFGLAPVTFGASLGLSIGGIVVAAAGGATSAGASIADVVLQKANVRETQEKLKEDQEALKPVIQLAGEMRQIVEQMEVQCPGVDRSTMAKFYTGIIAHSLVRGGNVAVKITEAAVTGILELGALALRVGGVAARAVAVAGIVLTVLLIPIDIVEIVRSGFNIYQGNESKAVIKLKELRKDLETEKITIHKIAYPENYEDPENHED